MPERYGLSGQPIGPEDQEPDTCWRVVIELERRWLARMEQKPKCSICDRPMVCGQRQNHLTCERLIEACQDRL